MNTIICLSSQNWENDCWTNKQHIMYRLAKRGYRVVHVNKGMGSIRSYYFGSDTIRPEGYRLPGVRKKDVNLYTADSYGLPFASGTTKRRNYSDYGFKIRSLNRLLKQTPAPLIWIYHPGYGNYLDKIPAACPVVYDCVDDYSSFPEYRDTQRNMIIEGEKKILNRAIMVSTTSRALFTAKKPNNPGTYYIHNVGDFDHFSRVHRESLEIPEAIRRIPGPKVGFAGAISNYKVDIRLMEHAARENSQLQFVLMGPVGWGDNNTDITSLQSLPNVHFFGRIEYSDLPNYLAGMDILMIPYMINEHTKHVFPIKFFESLATGKPCIITPLPSLKDYYAQAYVHTVDGDFSALLARLAASGNHPKKESQILLARKNTWDHRIDAILDAIRDQLPGFNVLKR